jgi:hypothetical protein
MRWLAANPAAELKAIKPDSSVTSPLLGGRFEKVIAATYEYYKHARRASDQLGAETATISKRDLSGSKLCCLMLTSFLVIGKMVNNGDVADSAIRTPEALVVSFVNSIMTDGKPKVAELLPCE